MARVCNRDYSSKFGAAGKAGKIYLDWHISRLESEGKQDRVEYYKCTECGGEFEDPKSKHDPLALAYKEYGRRHATGSV